MLKYNKKHKKLVTAIKVTATLLVLLSSFAAGQAYAQDEAKKCSCDSTFATPPEKWKDTPLTECRSYFRGPAKMSQACMYIPETVSSTSVCYLLIDKPGTPSWLEVAYNCQSGEKLPAAQLF